MAAWLRRPRTGLAMWPTTAQHVRDEFGDTVHVLDGGASEVGIESTILDLSRGFPALLRRAT